MSVLLKLFSNFQLLDQCAVFRNIFFCQVIEQTTAFADHLNESAFGMMILGIRIEMRRERVDLFGQNSNLNFRLSAIFRIGAIFRDKALRLFFRNWHIY